MYILYIFLLLLNLNYFTANEARIGKYQTLALVE